MVNDLVSNVDKLLQDDLVDVVDSSTTELQGKDNDFEGSDQSATQVKMTQEIEELRKQVKCLQKELRQLKTKPKFDIDEHKDSDDDVAFFTGFPSYDVMLFCFNLLKDKAAVMSRPNFDPNKRKPGTKKKLKKSTIIGEKVNGKLLLIAIFTKSWFVCYPLPSKLSSGHAAHNNSIYVRRGEGINVYNGLFQVMFICRRQ